MSTRDIQAEVEDLYGITLLPSMISKITDKVIATGLMSIFWTQKVKLFYAALLANNSH